MEMVSQILNVCLLLDTFDAVEFRPFSTSPVLQQYQEVDEYKGDSNANQPLPSRVSSIFTPLLC
jgi:hypothetical protein